MCPMCMSCHIAIMLITGGIGHSYSRIYMRGISFSGKNTSKIEHTVDFV